MYGPYYAIDPIGEDYVEQHGIRGQKWYHKNGPPYPLGSGSGSHRSAAEVSLNRAKASASAIAKGAGKVINSFNTVKDRKQASVDERNEYAKKAKEHRKQMTKGYHELSDDELDNRINRLAKEQRYKQLVDSVYPDQKKPGMLSSMTKKGVDALGDSLLKGVSKYLDKSIEKAIDDMIEGDEPSFEWWNPDEYMDTNKSNKEIKWGLDRAQNFSKGMQGMAMMEHNINRNNIWNTEERDIGNWYSKKVTKEQVDNWRIENDEAFRKMVSNYLRDELGGRPIE